MWFVRGIRLPYAFRFQLPEMFASASSISITVSNVLFVVINSYLLEFDAQWQNGGSSILIKNY